MKPLPCFGLRYGEAQWQGIEDRLLCRPEVIIPTTHEELNPANNFIDDLLHHFRPSKTQSAFYNHHVPEILNNIIDKIFLPH
ncbi:hypothetical protein H8959_002399 [Pygathrix nigripes]